VVEQTCDPVHDAAVVHTAVYVIPLKVPQQMSALEQVSAPHAITVDPEGHELWSATQLAVYPPSESFAMQHVDVEPEQVRDCPH